MDKLPDGRIKLSEPHLIEQIIQNMQLPDNLKPAATPAASSVILQTDLDGTNFVEK